MTAARRRLQSPTGTTLWRCVSPAGAATLHDTEQQAKNRAALHQGSIFYPIVVEERPTPSQIVDEIAARMTPTPPVGNPEPFQRTEESA